MLCSFFIHIFFFAFCTFSFASSLRFSSLFFWPDKVVSFRFSISWSVFSRTKPIPCLDTNFLNKSSKVMERKFWRIFFPLRLYSTLFLRRLTDLDLAKSYLTATNCFFPLDIFILLALICISFGNLKQDGTFQKVAFLLSFFRWKLECFKVADVWQNIISKKPPKIFCQYYHCIEQCSI